MNSVLQAGNVSTETYTERIIKSAINFCFEKSGTSQEQITPLYLQKKKNKAC